MTFPLFRKYPNNASFFRLDSAEEFLELKIMGSRYSLISIKAKILPDRNYITDMITMENDHWIASSEEEFERALKECRQNRKELL